MRRDMREVVNYLWQHHAAPWNFCLQVIMVIVLSCGLWLHNPVLLICPVFLFAGSLFTLPFPPMEQAGLGWLKRRIASFIEYERKFWLNFCTDRPWLKGLIVALFLLFWTMALWLNDIPFVLFVLLGGYMAKIFGENIQSGIKP